MDDITPVQMRELEGYLGPLEECRRPGFRLAWEMACSAVVLAALVGLVIVWSVAVV